MTRGSRSFVGIVLVASLCFVGASGLTALVNSMRICNWADAHLHLLRKNFGFLSPPATARALSIYTTCMWDAVAPFTDDWVGVIADDIPRRPQGERTADNQRKAASLAAYRAIVDIFKVRSPTLFGEIDSLLALEGLSASSLSTDLTTPEGVANVACDAVLRFRHNDGMNQLGDNNHSITGVAYSDYTNYFPINPAQPTPGSTDCSALRTLRHWQPLRVPTATGGSTVQSWLSPQMFRVTPFSLKSGDDLLSQAPGPALIGTATDAQAREEAAEVLQMSGTIGDREKVIAEFWADGPDSTLPPGHWHKIAVDLAQQRGLSMLQTIQLLFLQAQAVFDAGLACWTVKRHYDSIRPISLIQCLYNGVNVTAWSKPYRGAQSIPGGTWQPYQLPTFVTPGFAEYLSGHSSFSAASAEVLNRFFGSDVWGASYTVKAGQSLFEPQISNTSDPKYIAGVTDVPNSGPATVGYAPATDIVLSWDTFSQAADEAGISRRYGGIHFKAGDLHGRALGRAAGRSVWEKFTQLITPATQPVAAVSLDCLNKDDQVRYSVGGSLAGAVIANFFFFIVFLIAYCVMRPKAKKEEPASADPVKPASADRSSKLKRGSVRMDNPDLETGGSSASLELGSSAVNLNASADRTSSSAM